MAKPETLAAAEIEAALAMLPHWRHDGGALRAAYKFASFRDAVAFIARVAFEAEDLDHHPEITNVYNRVAFALTTHDAGNAVTDKDVALATRIAAAARPFLAKG